MTILGEEWRILSQRFSNKRQEGKERSRVWEWWESETAGADVDLQAVGAGPPQVDQKAVNPRVQYMLRTLAIFIIKFFRR